MSFRILLTNDDGIYAEGIGALALKINELIGDKVQLDIVAPEQERSAVGHSITMHKPLRVKETTLPKSQLIRGAAVNGSPSDCVKLAVEALLEKKPDLVVSGINRGSNLGTDVFYSGTVAAAVEGIILGIPSIAVSLASFEDNSFDFAAELTCKIISQLITEPLTKETILNINVPAIQPELIKGLKATAMGSRRYQNAFRRRKDPRGRSYYWLAGDVIEDNNNIDVDVGAVKNGYVSVTPIHLDLTKYKAIEPLKEFLTKINHDN